MDNFIFSVWAAMDDTKYVLEEFCPKQLEDMKKSLEERHNAGLSVRSNGPFTWGYMDEMGTEEEEIAAAKKQFESLFFFAVKGYFSRVSRHDAFIILCGSYLLYFTAAAFTAVHHIRPFYGLEMAWDDYMQNWNSAHPEEKPITEQELMDATGRSEVD